MGEHTPGPWIVTRPFPNRAILLIEQYTETDTAWIARTVDSTGRPHIQKEVEANARLIAAAPDLLAACELSLAWLDSVCDENFSLGAEPEGVEAKRQIVAAIAKAKGESDE